MEVGYLEEGFRFIEEGIHWLVDKPTARNPNKTLKVFYGSLRGPATRQSDIRIDLVIGGALLYYKGRPKILCRNSPDAALAASFHFKDGIPWTELQTFSVCPKAYS